MNMDDVLVVVAGHVMREEQRDHVLMLLNHLKNENLNVCYVTHSPKYIEDLSEHVDFLHYDKNNLLIDNADYLHNIHMVDDSCTEYGVCTYSSRFSFGKFTSSVIPAHCPALMVLLKHAVDIANTNHFKWLVFLEYDIKTPTHGFVNFIQDKLKELTNQNKECILYPRPEDGFVYPGILMFNSSKLEHHPTFLKKPWYASTQEWIKYWKLGFSETITENILRHVFDENILEYSIAQDAKKYWNTENYATIHKYNSFLLGYQRMVTLAPSKVLDKFALHLYMINSSETNNLECIDLTVINQSTGDILYKINDKHMNPLEWYFDTVDETQYSMNDTITLEYTTKQYDAITGNKETYDLRYIENIYKYVRKIEFNPPLQ